MKSTELTWKVLRGGSWPSVPLYVRSANRLRYAPDSRNHNFGFRVVRTQKRIEMKDIEQVIRSGAWYNFQADVRVASRDRIAPDNRYDDLGFRVVKKKKKH